MPCAGAGGGPPRARSRRTNSAGCNQQFGACLPSEDPAFDFDEVLHNMDPLLREGGMLADGGGAGEVCLLSDTTDQYYATDNGARPRTAHE